MRAIAMGVVLVFLAAAASAQDDYGDDRYGTGSGSAASDDAGRFSIRTGAGFHADPSGFLLGFEGDYTFSDHLSSGVLLELGVDDDRTIVSPVVYGRFRSDLAGVDRSLEAVVPYFQAGLGFTHWDQDRPRPGSGTTSDTEFLLNFGLGTDYWVLEDVSLGTHMMFNVIPDEIFGNRFYFSWEVLTLRYRF